MKTIRLWALLAVVGLCGTAGQAPASFFVGTTTNDRAASANFTASGGILTIVLTNTSTFDYAPGANKAVPADVLTGLFFDYQGGTPSLSLASAAASAITAGPNPANLRLSVTPGGWDYNQNPGGDLPGVTQAYGLGTAGFNVFAGATSSGGPGHPGNFGVMNSLYSDGDGNNPMTGTPYARNAITFTLGYSGTFDVGQLRNVRFQYGTALDEGHFLVTEPLSPPQENILPTPAPAGLGLVLSALPVVGFGLRRLRPTA